MVSKKSYWLVKTIHTMLRTFLKQQNTPVILDRTHENSHRIYEDVDLSDKLSAILHNEGIIVGLAYTEIMNLRSRNLPFNAGTAAYDLSKEEAIIVASEGDILDMKTKKLIWLLSREGILILQIKIRNCINDSKRNMRGHQNKNKH